MPYNKTQLPIKFSADLLNCRAALRYSKIGMFALRPQRSLFPNSGLGRSLSEKVRLLVMALNP